MVEKFLAETVKSGNESDCEDSSEDDEDKLEGCDEEVAESQKENLVARTVGVLVSAHFKILKLGLVGLVVPVYILGTVLPNLFSVDCGETVSTNEAVSALNSLLFAIDCDRREGDCVSFTQGGTEL